MAVPPVGTAHARPHPPQFALLLAVDTHAPPHSVIPSAHAHPPPPDALHTPSVGDVHDPDVRGVAEHCNDGPRHHVHRNDIRGSGLYCLEIANDTHGVFLTDNTLSGAPLMLALLREAGDVVARHNRFGASGAAPVYLSAGCGVVTLSHNVFETACTPDAVALIQGEAGPVVQSENDYCP